MKDLLIIFIILLVLLILISTFGGSIRLSNSSEEIVGIEKYEDNQYSDPVDPVDPVDPPEYSDPPEDPGVMYEGYKDKLNVYDEEPKNAAHIKPYDLNDMFASL